MALTCAVLGTDCICSATVSNPVFRPYPAPAIIPAITPATIAPPSVFAMARDPICAVARAPAIKDARIPLNNPEESATLVVVEGLSSARMASTPLLRASPIFDSPLPTPSALNTDNLLVIATNAAFFSFPSSMVFFNASWRSSMAACMALSSLSTVALSRPSTC